MQKTEYACHQSVQPHHYCFQSEISRPARILCCTSGPADLLPPHFNKLRTDHQRGEGVFDDSIRALKLLNEAGYGHEGTGLILDLVHNPQALSCLQTSKHSNLNSNASYPVSTASPSTACIPSPIFRSADSLIFFLNPVTMILTCRPSSKPSTLL